MSSSKVFVSLPVFEGFQKLVIWPEPDSVSKIFINCLELPENIIYFKIKYYQDKHTPTFSYLQNVSCYDLLSPDNILNPQLTGQITLPFYPGSRYAAVPGSSSNNVVQVDCYPTRPANLVYHDHCYHLMDIKVYLSLDFNFKFFYFDFCL